MVVKIKLLFTFLLQFFSLTQANSWFLFCLFEIFLLQRGILENEKRDYYCDRGQ